MAFIGKRKYFTVGGGAVTTTRRRARLRFFTGKKKQICDGIDRVKQLTRVKTFVSNKRYFHFILVCKNDATTVIRSGSSKNHSLSYTTS